MSTARTKGASSVSAMLYAGLAIMASAMVWWLIYYGQQNGMFGLLDVKLSCLSGDSFECSNIQEFIGPSAIPVYSPILLWVGTVAVVLGLYLTRRNKA